MTMRKVAMAAVLMAVAAGAWAQEAAIRKNLAERLPNLPAIDEEHFRLLTGFNDVFVGIATVILLAAVGFIGIFGLPLRVEAARHGAVGARYGAAWTWTDPLLDALPTTVTDPEPDPVKAG